MPVTSKVPGLAEVRDSYDRAADNYAALVDATGMGDLISTPWLRAAVDTFADAVAGLGPVLDVGCGPGTVTGYLHARGDLEISGVDLSERMVAQARRRHPECSFSVGSATELDLAPASLGGVLGWWSLFNLPRNLLPGVLADFARALVPGGQLILATHSGEGDLHRREAYGGVAVRWTTHLWLPEQFVEMLEQVGLRVVVELRLPADPPAGPTFVIVAQRD